MPARPQIAILPIAEAIAPLLGMKVEEREDKDRAVLTDSYGRRMSISQEWNSDKLLISGYFTPELAAQKRYNETFPSIKVSATKTPEQIAKDIERRLMPEYTTLLDALVKAAAEAQDWARAQDATVIKVANALGVVARTEDYPQPNAPRYRTLLHATGNDGRLIEAKVSGTHVTLEIRGLSIKEVESVIHKVQDMSGST